MKTSRALQISAAIILWVGLANGRAAVQDYYYSGPLTGSTEVDLAPPHGYGGIGVSFGTLAENIYFDPVAQTLEEVGSVTFSSPATGSFSMWSLGTPSAPSQDVGTATLTAGNGGGFSFDTGTVPAIEGSLYNFQPSILLPVSGSATYLGQDLTGSWDLDMRIIANVTVTSPTSLTLSETRLLGDDSAGGVLPGLQTGAGDDTSYYDWTLNSVTATSVPEPKTSTLIVGGFAVIALVEIFRRK